jgi:hypothetical protein
VTAPAPIAENRNMLFVILFRMRQYFMFLIIHIFIQRVAGEKENEKNKNKKIYINAIIRNAKRLEQVSQLLLDTACIEAKIFKLDKEQLNLADVLLNAVGDQIITIAQDFQTKNNIKLIHYYY